MWAQGYFKGQKVKHKSKIVIFCELINMDLLSGHNVMRRQVFMSFLLLLLYLITVACTPEISLGSCWHMDEYMGQRSSIHHNVQLFICLNNQFAIIQWPLLDVPTSTQCAFTTLSLSKYCLLRVRKNTMGSCWRKDILTPVLPSLFCNMIYQGVWFPSPYKLEIDGPKVLLFGTMV